MLYPNVGEPISKRRTPALSFAFTVSAAKTPTRASLALWQGARALGEAALPLGAPDAEGQLQHVSQLLLANLPSGEYTLAVTLMSGGDSETRRVTFRLVE